MIAQVTRADFLYESYSFTAITIFSVLFYKILFDKIDNNFSNDTEMIKFEIIVTQSHFTQYITDQDNRKGPYSHRTSKLHKPISNHYSATSSTISPSSVTTPVPSATTTERNTMIF